MNHFLDSYALIEIAKGNEKFNALLQQDLFTSIFNLYEFYYALLRDFNESTAKKFFYHFKEIIIRIKDEHIFEASHFKFINRKKLLSYADCLGYVMAKDYDMKFVTGDNKFENLENVEFIKK